MDRWFFDTALGTVESAALTVDAPIFETSTDVLAARPIVDLISIYDPG
jgi:hypothetical protein